MPLNAGKDEPINAEAPRIGCAAKGDAALLARPRPVSVRLGDLVSTGLVFLGVQLHLSTLGFALANTGAALAVTDASVGLR